MLQLFFLGSHEHIFVRLQLGNRLLQSREHLIKIVHVALLPSALVARKSSKFPTTCFMHRKR